MNEMLHPLPSGNAYIHVQYPAIALCTLLTAGAFYLCVNSRLLFGVLEASSVFPPVRMGCAGI